MIDCTNDARCSTEQDILILDGYRESAIFSHGGLVITFPANVLASISVKTTYKPDTLRNAIGGVLSLAPLLADSNNPCAAWLGVYFFRPDSETGSTLGELAVTMAKRVRSDILKQGTTLHPPDVELCIRMDANIFIRVSVARTQITTHVYKSERLATALFFARLIDAVVHARTGNASSIGDFVDAENDHSIEYATAAIPLS